MGYGEMEKCLPVRVRTQTGAIREIFLDFPFLVFQYDSSQLTSEPKNLNSNHLHNSQPLNPEPLNPSSRGPHGATHKILSTHLLTGAILSCWERKPSSQIHGF